MARRLREEAAHTERRGVLRAAIHFALVYLQRNLLSPCAVRTCARSCVSLPLRTYRAYFHAGLSDRQTVVHFLLGSPGSTLPCCGVPCGVRARRRVKARSFYLYPFLLARCAHSGACLPLHFAQNGVRQLPTSIRRAAHESNAVTKGCGEERREEDGLRAYLRRFTHTCRSLGCGRKSFAGRRVGCAWTKRVFWHGTSAWRAGAHCYLLPLHALERLSALRASTR